MTADLWQPDNFVFWKTIRACIEKIIASTFVLRHNI